MLLVKRARFLTLDADVQGLGVDHNAGGGHFNAPG